MTNYRVQWTASARQDLTEIIQYIAADNIGAGLKQLNKIEHRAMSLYQHPKRGRIVPEFLAIGISQYRELVIRPWRMLYRIEENQVYIIALLDSRRQLEDILLQRLVHAQ